MIITVVGGATRISAQRVNMNISGVTTCVGPIFASTLARALPVWINTLDSITVVTDKYGFGVARFEQLGIRLIVTDAFTRDGMLFNKGRALNEGIRQSQATDWILSFDADILPRRDWRAIAEKVIEPGNLYGAKRYGGIKIPYGYFQLWHTSDKHNLPFAEIYEHAGGYDADFLDQWPERRRIMLPIVVQELERRGHWFGPGNDHLMHRLLDGGIEAYRERGRKLV